LTKGATAVLLCRGTAQIRPTVREVIKRGRGSQEKSPLNGRGCTSPPMGEDEIGFNPWDWCSSSVGVTVLPIPSALSDLGETQSFGEHYHFDYSWGRLLLGLTHWVCRLKTMFLLRPADRVAGGPDYAGWVIRCRKNWWKRSSRVSSG
jgi:hypothetical protein